MDRNRSEQDRKKWEIQDQVGPGPTNFWKSRTNSDRSVPGLAVLGSLLPPELLEVLHKKYELGVLRISAVKSELTVISWERLIWVEKVLSISIYFECGLARVRPELTTIVVDRINGTFSHQNVSKKSEFRFFRVKIVFATGYRMVIWGKISHGKIL